MGFMYQIEKETEKAVFIKVPYWKVTGMDKKKHKQLYLTIWVPKSVVAKGDDSLKDFVIYQKAHARQCNTWTQGKKLPDYWNRLGSMAPEKVAKTKRVLDEDAYRIIVEKYQLKYQTESLRLLYHNPDSYNVSDEDYHVIEKMMLYTYGRKDDAVIPYKTETYYQ